MQQIAEIVISSNARELDKLFHYNVPGGLAVSLGSRVLVPFGRSSRTVEGTVIGFADQSPHQKLKSIKSVLDRTPLLTPALCNLVKFLRDRCLCTYYQALRAIMPSGVGVKTTLWYMLTDNDCDVAALCGKSKNQLAVVERLRQWGGTADFGALSDLPGAKNAIAALIEKGAVTCDEALMQNVKVKTVRICRLKMDRATLDEQVNTLPKNAVRQTAILEILRQTGEMPAADLVEFSGASYSTLNALARRGFVEFEDREVQRNVFDAGQFTSTVPKTPTPEQAAVLEQLVRRADSGDLQPVLLKGVTGSGKTEVFLQIIQHIIKSGRQAIVLVPEISLTPQMVERFVGRFGQAVSVLHSALSMGERYDQWRRIRNSEVSVVVGARSAIFAPFDNLGIIIIDEEQETAYKSESAPHYQARDVALWRSRNEGAMVLLGSATPSVESYYRAQTGLYALMEMKSRHNRSALPNVYIADMRREMEQGNKSPFSALLKREMDKNIEQGKQTILFHNRRGFNSFVQCRTCGEGVKCPNCSITMTYHKFSDTLQCHYCGAVANPPKVCPSCGSEHIRYMGAGTEKIEEALAQLYGPDSFIRMDRDTTGGKNAHQTILHRFEKENIPILLGTQMVTKGLDFPNVTLVGVLAADLSLNMDDYRSGERTFSQLTQVCGRAGRGSASGRAVVQTYQPQHYAVRLAKTHDYDGFYQNEIALRKSLNFPPLCDMVMLLLQGQDGEQVQKEISYIAAVLRKKLEGEQVQFFGPAPAPYARINGRWRWRLLIKCPRANRLLGVLHDLLAWHSGNGSDTVLTADVNPASMN